MGGSMRCRIDETLSLLIVLPEQTVLFYCKRNW